MLRVGQKFSACFRLFSPLRSLFFYRLIDFEGDKRRGAA